MSKSKAARYRFVCDACRKSHKHCVHQREDSSVQKVREIRPRAQQKDELPPATVTQTITDLLENGPIKVNVSTLLPRLFRYEALRLAGHAFCLFHLFNDRRVEAMEATDGAMRHLRQNALCSDVENTEASILATGILTMSHFAAAHTVAEARLFVAGSVTLAKNFYQRETPSDGLMKSLLVGYKSVSSSEDVARYWVYLAPFMEQFLEIDFNVEGENTSPQDMLSMIIASIKCSMEKDEHVRQRQAIFVLHLLCRHLIPIKMLEDIGERQVIREVFLVSVYCLNFLSMYQEQLLPVDLLSELQESIAQAESLYGTSLLFPRLVLSIQENRLNFASTSLR